MHDSASYLSRIPTERPKQGSISVHDDKAILVVRLEQLIQGFSVKLVVTQIQRRVDGLEGLKVNIQLLLLAIVGHNSARVYDQSIWRNFIVQLEPLLSRSDGR